MRQHHGAHCSRSRRFEAGAARSHPPLLDLSCQCRETASGGWCDKYGGIILCKEWLAAVRAAFEITLEPCRSRSSSASILPGPSRRGIASRARSGPQHRSNASVSRASTYATLIFTLAIALSGDFGFHYVDGKTIKPAWQWDGQRLFSCAIPKPDAETQCKCYEYKPTAVVPCIESEPENPEFETFPGRYGSEFSRWKSCTHDPKVQYGCKDPNDPVISISCNTTILVDQDARPLPVN